MPSSGAGNSFNNDYVRCQQYFYNRHRRGLTLAGQQVEAAPTAVGSAVHDAIAQFLVGQAAFGLSYEECCAVMWREYDAYVAPHLGDGAEDSLGAVALRERAEVGRAVLGTWAARQWVKLDSMAECTLGVEWAHSFELPAEFAGQRILEPLRRYTVRLDHVYRLPDGTVCIRDWKTTRANKPADEARNYLMSDQHLGYAWAWQQAHPADRVYTIEYSMLRMHPRVVSVDAFHDEPRDVVQEQLDDWYQRMLTQRVEMSAKWDAPRHAWLSNTSSHGPCMVYGRECVYGRLCRRPWEYDTLVAAHYVQEEAA